MTFIGDEEDSSKSLSEDDDEDLNDHDDQGYKISEGTWSFDVLLIFKYNILNKSL